MKPTTRLETRRQQECCRRTHLQVRKMDPSIFNKYAHIPPYNTRSSPKKKDKGKESSARVSWKWDDEKRALFFSLCVEEVQNGMRSGAGLKPESWKWVGLLLSEAFGGTCVGTQVRNFWNQQKGFWQIANSLRSATGLGFNLLNDTISADDEWWTEAIKVVPDVKLLWNKNIVELLNYGDILFRNVTATGEHVTYPSTAGGQPDITDITRRLDLNSDPYQGDDVGSYIPRPAYTPGSGSRAGRKRKSIYSEAATSSKKQAMSGLRLIASFDDAVSSKLLKDSQQNLEKVTVVLDLDSCMPFLKEIMDYDEELFMYGATLLGSNEKYMKTFISMETIDMKVRWLMYMQRKGFQ